MKRALKILSRIVLIGFISALFSLGFVTEAKAYNVDIQKISQIHASIAVQQNAETGDEVTFTITPDEGYYIENLSVLSVDSGAIEYQVVGSNNNPSKPMQYKFTVPDDAIAVSISAWGSECSNQIVSFACEGNGTTSPAAGAHQYLDFQEVAITATPDPGNIFNGWTATQGTFEDASSASTTYTVPRASNIRVTANFAADTTAYDINLSTQGQGSVSAKAGSTPVTSATYGTNIKLTATPDPGWTFSGWQSADVTISNPTSTTEASFSMPQRAVTATAVFTALPTYNITLDYNNGSGTTSSATTGTDGKLASIPNYPVWTGHTCTGWYTAATGGDEVTTSTIFSSNTRIYAHWTETPARADHTVTYKVVHGKWNDGSTGTKSETVADNAHLAHIPSVGSKPDDGYKAGSWSPSTPSSSTAITEDIEYTYTYASESAKTYTVATSDDGHGRAKASPTSGETGTKVTITATPDKDHQFKEWKVIKGGVELADKKKKVTTFNIKDSNVEVKAIFEEEEDDDDDEDDEDHTPSWVLNPNEKQQLVITFAGSLGGFTAGYQEQGEVAQGLFKKETPAGYQKAFSFNILKDGKPDYSLKKGTLTLIIPPEYRKAGRQFAILAMGRNGQVIYLPDSDADPNTVTVGLNLEGYALQLIYSD